MKYINIILFIATVIFFVSCYSDRPVIVEEDFRITVDRVVVPAYSVFQTDTLVLKIWAHVGDDSCHQFSHFQGTISPTMTDIMVWGHYSYISSKTCTPMSVDMKGEQLRIFPLQAGTYSITIRQPDGITLQYSKEIRP
jgi:hypothetical protein